MKGIMKLVIIVIVLAMVVVFVFGLSRFAVDKNSETETITTNYSPYRSRCRGNVHYHPPSEPCIPPINDASGTISSSTPMP